MSIVLEKGLPQNINAEKFILGNILLDDSRFVEVASTLNASELSLEKHRRIFVRMAELSGRGEKIDRVTLANELMRHSELESVDGLTYLCSLDDGMPRISNLEAYVKIVKDKAMLRRIAVGAQLTLTRALTAEESPDEILAGAEEALLGIKQERQGSEDEGLLSAGDFLSQFPGGFNAFAEPYTRATGLATGFRRYDEMTGGMRRGELTILAARPAMGKSALAMNMAWNVATHYQEPVAVFSLEMSRESLLLRMLCSAARIDSQRLRAGYLNEGERTKIREARSMMMDAPLYIDDSSNIGLMELRAKLRRFRQVHKRGVRLVVIDYLQLMVSGNGRTENRTQEVSKLSRGLKLLSKEEDCAFLVLSQLSRASETRTGDHRPQLSDLRESGSIEQDADLVAFIFREELYKRDREDLRGIAELILAKQRNGPIGKIDLVFIHSMTKFETRAEDLGDLPPEEARLPYAG